MNFKWNLSNFARNFYNDRNIVNKSHFPTSVSETIRKPPIHPKAHPRQSPNCIKKPKKKYGDKRFSTWRMELLHPAMWHDHDIDFARWLQPSVWHAAHGIMTVNSPSGSTLQCDTWLWDDMPLNSPGGSTLQCGRWLWDDTPKRLSYISTSGFDFNHITAVDMSFCTSLQNFIQIGPASAE